MKNRFLVLVIYCLPCLVSLLLLIEYKGRTNNVAEEIKNIASYIKEPERFIITEETLEKLNQVAYIEQETLNNVLKKLTETKDWKSKDKELFLKDLREIIPKLLKEKPAGTDYSKFESEILEYAKIEINLVEESKISEEFEALFVDRKYSTSLINFFILQKELGTLNEKISKIGWQIFKIWIRNSIIITLMVFLPFILLGFRLAFGSHVEFSLEDRKKAAWRNWAMKTVVACVILIGWMYVLNPLGRAATTIEEYFIIARVVENKTIPVYIATENISNTLAGFLGWYLYLLLYFFSKLYQNDVKSARVYRFLFGKFLFTYGISLTSSAFFGDETQAAMFLIGFFPLSAVSVIKEYGLKATKGIGEGKTGLSELPSISTWHILRLEEEGIDSIPTLANSDLEVLKDKLPNIMIPLVDLWIDVAQLYTILGGERYQKCKALCQTASEFISLATDPTLQSKLKDCEIENPQEIVNLLYRTFNQEKLGVES